MVGAAGRIAGLMILALLVPSGGAPVRAAEPPSLPRVAGIVVGPDSRAVIFADDTAGGWTVLREGDAIGAYRIRTITPGMVIVLGPDGATLAIAPTPNGQPAGVTLSSGPLVGPSGGGEPSPAETGAVETGAAIGRLAAEHDACVGQGFLPRPERGAQAQLQTMLEAMSRLPPHAGTTHAVDPAGPELAQAMRAGAEAATQAAAASSYDASRCALVDAQWQKEGIRYGFR